MRLADAPEAMERALAEVLPFALMDASQRVADSAQSSHRYQNRTGQLEANTRPESVRGSWSSGYTLTIVGARPYGSFLEEGTPTIHGFAFLLPAWDRVGQSAADEVAEAMARAIDEMD